MSGSSGSIVNTFSVLKEFQLFQVMSFAYVSKIQMGILN